MNNIDKENMYQVLKDFPKQFRKALEFAKNIKAKKSDYKKLIVAGMGGSALPADILKLVTADQIEIEGCQNYKLPKKINPNTLVFTSSYSGNTEETLSAAEDAKNRGLDIVGFAKGGKLLSWCQENGYPCVQYPDDGPDFQPRMGNGYAFTSMFMVLVNSGIINQNAELIKKLNSFLDNYNPEEKAKKTAAAIKKGGFIPIIYASDFYKDTAARIVKIKINENSKMPCFYNYFSELNHFEMNSFTNPQIAKFYFITFFADDDSPRIVERMKLTAKIYQETGHQTEMIEMEGGNPLEKAYSAIVFGDWLSYYLALEYNVDPTPIEIVEKFKKMLG